MNLILLENYLIFLSRPVAFFHIGIQVIKPSLSALFATSTRNYLWYLCPVVRSIFCNPLLKEFILFFRPRPFHKSRLKNFCPSVNALNGTSSVHFFWNFFPRFLADVMDHLTQQLVLFIRPFTSFFSFRRVQSISNYWLLCVWILRISFIEILNEVCNVLM